MKRIAGFFAVSMLVMSGMAVAAHEGHDAAPAAQGAEKAVVYTCPMHPDVKAAKAGNCPTCGMALEPVKEKMAYACPMCPGVEDSKPGACPHCGMPLEEKKA